MSSLPTDYNTPALDDLYVELNVPRGIFLESFGSITVYTIFTSFVGGDCRAIKVGDEVVWDGDDEHLSIRDRILSDVIRDAIIKDPHGNIFCHKFREHQNFTIEVYMFQTDGYRVIFDFDHEKRQFNISILCSEAFLR